MDNTTDLLTVAQLAELVGVTKQAIYKRLDKDLMPYVTIIDNKRYLSPDAAALFDAKPAPAADAPDMAAVLLAQIDTLTAQLAEKDRQIDRMQTTIEAQNATIAQQNQLQANLQMMITKYQLLDQPDTGDNQPTEQPLTNGVTSWFNRLKDRIARH